MKVSGSSIVRPLGTMVAYGFERGSVHTDLDVADRLAATHLEILPDWARFPSPTEMGTLARDRGFTIHSAHGCWGRTSIHAAWVDLGSTVESVLEESVDDLKRCLDWLTAARGSHLIVHPGGLSDEEEIQERTVALRLGLERLSDHAAGSELTICVENMPSGVHPGSRMRDLAALIRDLGRANVRLALDTGHANIVATAHEETRDTAGYLGSTHVHDNNGRQDTHEPPGLGTVDWVAWAEALDAIDYRGPIMLECIRILRRDPTIIDEVFRNRLAILTGSAA